MKFSELKDCADLARVFTGMIDSGRIPHAIMLHEDDGGGGIAVALAFLQYLYCRSRNGDSCGECPSCNRISKLIHPDVHFIYPMTSGNLSLSAVAAWRELVTLNPYFTESDFNEALAVQSKSTLISVGEANSILSTLALSSLEGGYRSVVIYLPEKMNQEASNRLLKVIEEPEPQTLFLMVTHSPENVLTTIRSRCQMFRLKPGDAAVISDSYFEELFAALMEALCSRDLSLALESADTLSSLPSRENAKAFCKFASVRLREIFLSQQGIGSASSSWAGKCGRTFPRKALEAFDRASLLIDRNVNQKILFTDLIDRLFMIV